MPLFPTAGQRNTLNLHLHPFRQLVYRYTTPRRLRRPIHTEMFLIFPIHLGEILHVCQEDGGFYDAADVGARGREDGF